MIYLSPVTTASLATVTKHLECVLFVQARPPIGEALIKIDPTKEPSTRLRALQEDNAHETFLVGLMPTANATEVASALAEQYKAQHVRGSWYHPSGALLAFVNNAAQKPLKSLLGKLRQHSLPDGTLTIDELAKYLRIPTRTLRRFVSLGAIPYLRVGKYLRFVPDDVRATLSAY